MGIVNREGALYMATGIDNSGLYKGRQEALGIIKAMAGEITSFDVFGGIGISAGIAFASAAKDAYAFEKQFESSMKEVATISDIVKESMDATKQKIISLTTDEQIPIGANEMAKALYGIVSAGHDGEKGMHVLEVSAKAAVGGITETATAADAITTLLNAYKKDASEAERVSDMLFTTAKLGKTTFGEMGKSIAQVAPVAAAYGVEMDQVLAAVATLTKQGTPTAQAMTQIRAAIVGASKYLGDGAYNAMSFQEALVKIREEANGSEAALISMIPELEARNGLLALTGINAKEASGHLDEMAMSAGATEKAFKEMASSAENQLKLLGNNITGMLRPMGQGILKEVSEVSTAINKAFDDGKIEDSLQTLGDLVVIVTGALIGYKGAIMAGNKIKMIHASLIEAERYEMALYRKAVEAGAISENVLTSAQVKQMATRNAMITTIKLHTATLMRNAAAMLSNPYVMAAAAISTLGFIVYKYATRVTGAEAAQRKFNAAINEQKKSSEALKEKISDRLRIIKDETIAESEKLIALNELQEIMPAVFKNLDLEILKRKELVDIMKEVNAEDERQKRIGAKTKLVMAQQRLRDIDNRIIRTNNVGGYTGALEERRKEAAEEVRLWEERVKIYEDAQKKIEDAQNGSGQKTELRNKAYWEKEKKDAEDALSKMDVSKKGSKEWNNLISNIEKYQKEIDKYDVSKSVKSEIEIKKAEEKIASILAEQMLERKRLAEDLQIQIEESRLVAMNDGVDKTIAQMELNFEKEMQAIDRQKEDALRRKIENARAAFEADPENKDKVFDSSGVELSDKENKLFDDLYKAAVTRNERAYFNLANQYQSYTDERLSIEKKFNDDVILLQEARKKAAANGNADEISKIDRSIAKATADKGKALMKHDFEVLKQSPEYIRAFEDLRNTSSETLSSLLEQLEGAKETAASVLNPEDLREYTTTIQDIMNELEERNPFQSLADRQHELAEAERELAEAKRMLDAVMNGAKIVTGIKSTKLGTDGLINIENTYLSAEDALKKYNKAKDKAYKANNNFVKAEEKAKEKVDKLAESIISIGNAIGGQSGEIISLIGDVSLFASESINGITMVAKTGAEAMSAVEKASVILGIVSAGIQLLQKLNSLLPTAESRYEEFAAKVAEINKITDAVNEYRIAAIEARHAEEDWFSENNLKGLRNYREVHDEIFKAYKDKANERQAVYQNQKGGGWLTGSLGYGLLGGIDALFGTNILGNKYDENTVEAIKNLRIETRKRSRGLLGSGLFGRDQKTEDLVSWARNNGFGELFGKDNLINKDAAKAIIDKYGDKLVGQTKETLESLVKLREKYDEYIEKLHEYVNSLYEPLVDNFVDSIWTWLSDGKDALKSFREYAGDTFKDIANDMLKSIVLSKIFGKGENSYQSKINKAYEDYAKKLIDEVELNRRVSELTKELMGTAEQQLPVIQGMAKNINDTIKNIAGIDITGDLKSDKGVTGKIQEALTEGTANQLVGLWNMSSLDIRHIKEFLQNIPLEFFRWSDDIRIDVGQIMLLAAEIKNNTERTADNTYGLKEELREIKNEIIEVKRNTKGYTGRG
ncbi:TP901 family phage tail tape measure protein [Bacteroides heparinolyticus]|uniref:TP901 family phage tail tape measure protein n=1 Tax=Prevotella heparinolytica TaxID=28113 RepID=A0A4R2LHT2_9BACE|nr:phage tail tape measure protein [Bacteroides heparinolyticus]TCO87465.1 TP901 family phage tail tape measure protein [Bacteroides heparinolyticus]